MASIITSPFTTNQSDELSPIIAPQISVVSTMYRSRPFLETFLSTCLEALHEMQVQSFEMLAPIDKKSNMVMECKF